MKNNGEKTTIMPAIVSTKNIEATASILAEAAKARIQAAYVMALEKPRNEDNARAKIIQACKRPKFADKVQYSKPIGTTKVKGPSVRFAELAIRSWGNIDVETIVTYEDDSIRKIQVRATDLENNSTYSKTATINKTVERKNDKGREILSTRMNTYGEVIYICKATEEETAIKEAAIISKIIRNEGLRLIPSDIVEEAIDTAIKTMNNEYEKDPIGEKNKILDTFLDLGVYPQELEKLIGHKLDSISAHELQQLRNICRSIKDGEASWKDFIEEKKEPSTLEEMAKEKQNENKRSN
jgi:hypothetical protein